MSVARDNWWRMDPLYCGCQRIVDPEQRFDGLPILTEYIDGRIWRLARNLSYSIATGDFSGKVSTCCAGFEFDWASIPRFLWRLFPQAGLPGQPYGIAALFHDWVYVHQRIQGIPCTRLDADRLFLEILLYTGISHWRARLMYRAVRLGGGGSWYRNAKNAAGRPTIPENCLGSIKPAAAPDRPFASNLTRMQCGLITGATS